MWGYSGTPKSKVPHHSRQIMHEPANIGRDIYVKYTAKDGQSYTQYHRVWDIGLFMAAREADAKKAGGKWSKS